MNYACYQDARFIIVGTPSGISLAPEGGAHQSIYTPLIGIGQPGLTAFEPAYVDELSEISDGASSICRTKTAGRSTCGCRAPMAQRAERKTTALKADILAGAYWLVARPGPKSRSSRAARSCRRRSRPPANRGRHPRGRAARRDLADRLHRGWLRSVKSHLGAPASHVEPVLGRCAQRRAGLVTALDGHPATLSWLGAVGRHRVMPLGVENSAIGRRAAISTASTASMPTPSSARPPGCVLSRRSDSPRLDASRPAARRRKSRKSFGLSAIRR